MRGLKKVMFCFLATLCICCSNKVYANAQQVASKDALTLLNEAEAAMNKQVRVDAEYYINDNGTPALLMAVKADVRNKNSYINFFGIEMWTDGQKKLAYVKMDKDGYSVMPVEKSNVTVTEDKGIDTSYSYVYSGTTVYQGVTCDVVTGTKQKEQIIYYIAQTTNLILYEEDKTEDTGIKVYITYPQEYLEVPDSVKNSATVAANLTVSKKGITYRTKEVKGKTVCYATQISKSKASATIEDTVSVCGKEVKVYGISANAFKGRSKLKSLTIGKNVQTIGSQAFYKCKRLSKITIKSTKLKSIGKKAFDKTAKTLQVKVPKKTAKKYKNMINKSKISSKLKIKKF